MQCPMCNGTGQRHYIPAGRNADGKAVKERTYSCAWCKGTGQVSGIWAEFVEMELRRMEGAGVQTK